MLKTMENYKKGVQYFNSFGLDQNDEKGHHKKTSQKVITGEGSFWDLN